MAMIPTTITSLLSTKIHIIEEGFAIGGMIVNWIGKMNSENVANAQIVT